MERYKTATEHSSSRSVHLPHTGSLQVVFLDHPFKLCQYHDDLQSNQQNGILDLKTAHYIKSAHPELTSLARFIINRSPGNTENGLHSAQHIYK
jgi:16S rRNA G966 N2-methylase RsmD